MAPFSALMRTTAVIMSAPSQALHVDVMEGRLHEVRGLLHAHRLPARQGGGGRIVDVMVGFFLVLVERLFELVDGQLDPVPCCAADQLKPPGACSKARIPAGRLPSFRSRGA